MSVPIGKILNYGLDAVDVGSTYIDSRKQGTGVIGSVAKAGVEQALWIYAPALQWTRLGLDVGGAIIGGTKDAIISGGRNAGKMQSRAYKTNFGGHYQETQNAYTMRQRGIQAMQRSGNNINSVLGNEARTVYRSY